MANERSLSFKPATTVGMHTGRMSITKRCPVRPLQCLSPFLMMTLWSTTLASPARPSTVAHDAPHGIAVCKMQTLSRLHFGMQTPQGVITEPQWQWFIDQFVSRRLRDFTVLSARSQWRLADGRVAREDSRVVEVVADDSATQQQALAEIVSEYKRRFQQESVTVMQHAVRNCV